MNFACIIVFLADDEQLIAHVGRNHSSNPDTSSIAEYVFLP